MLNSANVALLLSTISVNYAKIGNEDTAGHTTLMHSHLQDVKQTRTIMSIKVLKSDGQTNIEKYSLTTMH